MGLHASVTRRQEMAENQARLSQQLLASLATSIERGEPLEEIRDMVVECISYRNMCIGWRHPRSGLNLLQHAIVCRHLDMVGYLCQPKRMHLFAPSSNCGFHINPPMHLACKVGAIHIIRFFIESHHMDISEPAIVTWPMHPDDFDMRHSRKKAMPPYEICVAEKHLDAANFLSRYIINKMGKPIHPIKDSPMLHQVTYLGCGAHVQLLLESGYIRHLHDKDKLGYQPIHIASLTAEPRCMEVLLEQGAVVNSRTDHRTCLHLMYGAKFQPENFFHCTQVLVEYGIDIDGQDHNNNTALDYLAWELSQKWHGRAPSWLTNPKAKGIIDYILSRETNRPVLDGEQIRNEIFKCMDLLLQAGACTCVRTRNGLIDHTILHTLLQNTGWPLNSSMRKRPLEVYKALKLFFYYGADPNVIARNNNESALTMLLMHSLHEIPVDLKCQFVVLFIMNGADLENLIPEPKGCKDNYDGRWNIYPVMLALQERHCMEVIQLLYDYMSLPAIYHSLQLTKEQFLWHRMTWSLGGAAKDQEYKEQWMAIRFPKLRSLRHTAKLVILRSMHFRAGFVQALPLPMFLKLYLQSNEC